MNERRKIIWPVVGSLAIIISIALLQKQRKPSYEAVTTDGLTNAEAPKTSTTMSLPSPPAATNRRTIDMTRATRVQTEQTKRDSEAETILWQSPLLYYGKVVDENGAPIHGAVVSYGANSLSELQKEVYNTGTVTSDERGIFKIDGVRGVGLFIQLSHPRYYSYPDNSTGFDKRSLPKKGYYSDSEEKAELFRMHSKGSPAPLVHRRGGADVPVNSGSAAVAFYGQQDKQVVGTLEIQAWGRTPNNWSPTPYDWSVQLTVPNGGLLESTNQFDFVAPDSGYLQSIRIDMKMDQQGWSDSINKSYFIKLPNGYARMTIHLRAKTPLYSSLDYYYNPDGSANLEPAN